ncbi:hypothetical protein E3N88_25545 [Mikania micrantha]|uniref:Uncharacterized protein n=1 Tax=Mikania micrantha TaxID=192012 RepID=A0A5N6N5F8_9ASTR|nr:hypothetical protein E3N88_25545 [Mikania micrantha]
MPLFDSSSYRPSAAAAYAYQKVSLKHSGSLFMYAGHESRAYAKNYFGNLLRMCLRDVCNSIGVSLNKHLRKEEVILRKQHCFRRITGSCRRLYKTTASEESSYALKTKTSEVYPLTKTVAAYSHSTKGTDTRHAGLSKDKDNM